MVIGYLDGEKINNQQQLFLGPGLFWGYGLFETVLVKKSRLIFIEEHLERMVKSAADLGFDYAFDLPAIKMTAEVLVSENDLMDGALKITLFKGQQKEHLLLSADARFYPPQTYLSGMSVLVSDTPKNEASLVVRHKTLQYLENILQKKKAADQGFDDTLFVNTKGFLAETSVANLFFIKNKELYTPHQDSGILEGIVRDKVIQIAEAMNIPVHQGFYLPEMLAGSDAVFLTNSLLGIMPVSRVGKNHFTVNHSMMQDLQNAYLLLCEEE